jgi:hypothetical protein
MYAGWVGRRPEEVGGVKEEVNKQDQAFLSLSPLLLSSLVSFDEWTSLLNLPPHTKDTTDPRRQNTVEFDISYASSCETSPVDFRPVLLEVQPVAFDA